VPKFQPAKLLFVCIWAVVRPVIPVATPSPTPAERPVVSVSKKEEVTVVVVRFPIRPPASSVAVTAPVA
jgi:hypothetical protein